MKYSSESDYDSDILIKRKKLIWIDENIDKDHPDADIYAEEIENLEKDIQSLKNEKENLKIKQQSQYNPQTKEQLRFYDVLYHVKKSLDCDYHRRRIDYHCEKRYDDIEHQMKDLIELAKTFGLIDCIPIIDDFIQKNIARQGKNKFDNYMHNVDYKIFF